MAGDEQGLERSARQCSLSTVPVRRLQAGISFLACRKGHMARSILLVDDEVPVRCIADRVLHLKREPLVRPAILAKPSALEGLTRKVGAILGDTP